MNNLCQAKFYVMEDLTVKTVYAVNDEYFSLLFFFISFSFLSRAQCVMKDD